MFDFSAELASLEMAAGQAWRWFSVARHFEEATRRPDAAQRDRLLTIVRRNRATEFGRRHGFADIRSVADYQRRVPIHRYEELELSIQRMAHGEPNVLTADRVLMFATTSGTSGSQKMIPVTPSYLAEYNQAIQVHTWRMIRDAPHGASGKFLVTSSRDVEGFTPAGIPFGALSGFMVRRQPSMVQSHFVLPYQVALITDVELKYYLTARLALDAPLSAISTLNPSSILLVCQTIQQHAERLIRDIRDGRADGLRALSPPLAAALAPRVRPNPQRADELASLLRETGELTPTRLWPAMSMIACWKGGTMPLYLKQIRRWFGDVPVRDRGYMASEGIGSIPLVDSGAAGALAVTTHFYEFIPVDRRDEPDPPVYTAAELEPNRDYYVLFTTSAGLYRYDINDIVRVVDFYRETPVIEFVRKGRGMTNLTGEKLAEQQVTAAMMGAVAALRLEEFVKHFTVVPEFGALPRYIVLIEPGNDAPRRAIARLAVRLDRELLSANVEYQSKRETLRLGPPEIRLVARGTYDAFRQQRVLAGAPEAQVKVPHLSPDMSFGKSFDVIDVLETPLAAAGPP